MSMAALLQQTIGNLTPGDVQRHVQLARTSLQAQSYFVDALSSRELYDLHAQAIPHDDKRAWYVDAFLRSEASATEQQTNVGGRPDTTVNAAPQPAPLRPTSPRGLAHPVAAKGHTTTGNSRTTKRDASALAEEPMEVTSTATSSATAVISPRSGAAAAAPAIATVPVAAGTAAAPVQVPPVVGIPTAVLAPASG